MSPNNIDIECLCKRLHLANAPRVYRDLAVRAEAEQWPYRDFLAVLLSEEVAHRQQTRLQRLTRKAYFPFLKTIEEFDFTHQSTLRLSMMGTFLSPDFVTDGRCLILSGKTGRGKTHLAIATAYKAIQNGFDALFTTAPPRSSTSSPRPACRAGCERRFWHTPARMSWSSTRSDISPTAPTRPTSSSTSSTSVTCGTAR